MRPHNAESSAIDGADAEEDAALGVSHVRQRQRQGAGRRSEREATPPAGGGFSRRDSKQELMPSFATMYVPSPGVMVLPALQRRPAFGTGVGEGMGETSGGALSEASQQQQEKKRRGEQRYAGIDSATSAIYANQQQRKLQIPTKRKDPVVPLAPLLSKAKRRLDQQAAVAAEEEARIASSMTVNGLDIATRQPI